MVKAYEAMANQEELDILRDPHRDESLASKYVNGLTLLLVKRILQSYTETDPSKKPKELGIKSTIYINTMVDAWDRHSNPSA